MKAEGFPVRAACESAEVSTSADYDWCAKVAAGPSTREWDETLVVNEMLGVHARHDDTYGSPRMTAELQRRGNCGNHARIERLVAEHGIVAAGGQRRRVRTTTPGVAAPPLPDLVRRDFSVGEPGLRACGDITYIPTAEGWLSLASVLGLGSRRLVGWAMGERMPSELCRDPINMAVATRGGEVRGMIFPHDRGSQYLSSDSSTSLRTSGRTAPRSASSHPSAGSARATTTARRNPSGRSSRGSSSAVSASKPGPKPGTPSPPRSRTTTPPGCTARSGISRPSSGSCAIVSTPSKTHHHVSGRRGGRPHARYPRPTPPRPSERATQSRPEDSGP
jgi:transposase InsO family protein